MKEFYSHGKILLTGEYAVLDGVKALALPTIKGQVLKVFPNKEPSIIWKSFHHQGKVWIDAVFDLKGKCISPKKTKKEQIERLEQILSATRLLAPRMFQEGIEIQTFLEFPSEWGLGSSSTLINNLSQWAGINPYQLLDKTFGGSGYDIAAAQNSQPIFYQRQNVSPIVIKTNFAPAFHKNLFFIYLNQKQNSRKAIAAYQKNEEKPQKQKILEQLEIIGQRISTASTQVELNTNLKEHEQLIAQLIGQEPIQNRLFPDFNGQLKSLGAWGGDFILASGNIDTPSYFQSKGYTTIFSYRTFILNK